MANMIDEGIKFDLILTDPPYNLKKDFGNDS
ncbi:site-specific DNA-methyltransferase, partial [Listeria monocytogenes]|nr:site-specific DNA-methyltransferase [Listeria monocytogenes]